MQATYKVHALLLCIVLRNYNLWLSRIQLCVETPHDQLCIHVACRLHKDQLLEGVGNSSVVANIVEKVYSLISVS